MDRRSFLKGMVAGAVVVGFDVARRRWLTADQAVAAGLFDGVPPLDGVLVMDGRSLAADAVDRGNIVTQTPAAVLRPGSVADIAAMIGFCRPRGIKVARRGQAHTTFGQSLTSGLVIEHGALTQIHSMSPSGADVDAGVLWRDLITAAYPLGLTPPAVTGYTKLSVGGTLSVGGVPGIAGSTVSGCQIDRVQELQVVTGVGEIVECSEAQNADLFHAMLGGLGQCGVITRATLDLVPAKKRARSYLLHYADNATFFRDLRMMLARPGLDQVYLQCFPPGTSKIYQLNAVVFYDHRSDRPTDHAILRGVHTVPVIEDQSYLDYLFFVDTLVDSLRAAADWDRLVKPWFDVWLPDSQVEQFVGEVLPTLGPSDVGPGGFVLTFPVLRSRVTRPFFPVPEADGNGWIYLFDVLTASALPGAGPAFVDRMLARNRRLYDQARAAGGTRYCIGSIPFTQTDWVSHYGAQWSTFQQLKQTYDPDGILTPGPGIFE
jgi:FAD/FMN-containing dehydrogenase